MQDNKHISGERLEAIPSQLETHASGRISPPLPKANGTLPLGELSWDDLERLCLRLARKQADVLECRLYGVPGDRQYGIDLYSRRQPGGSWTVYQCKRVKRLSASSLEKASQIFLSGAFAAETEQFVFCTNQSLRPTALDNAWQKIRKVLEDRGIRAVRWDADELNELLRGHREIVFDFFGRAWFAVFFGEEPTAFARRLAPEEVVEFRRRCHSFYATRNERLDSGAVLARRSDWIRSSLAERFVVPDVLLPSPDTDSREPLRSGPSRSPSAVHILADSSVPQLQREASREKSGSMRIAVDRWLGIQQRQLILGAPGIGKSTLLRMVAMDLLSETPQLAEVARRWGLLLPIWVPFPYWTAQVAAHHGATSTLPEMLREWFEREHQMELWPLIQRALDDERVLLLVDGLDEYADENAAGLVLQQLLSFLDARPVPALLACRQHGFDTLQGNVKTWSRALLAPLSLSQQEAFAQALFRADAHAQSLAAEEVSQYADRRAHDFCNEICGSAGLADLAGVPLLLGLFVRLVIEGKCLPEDRFDACARLVDLLLEEHPKRRLEAANRVFTASGTTLKTAHIGKREIRLAFAALAFALQMHATSGQATKAEVVRWLVDYLHAERWNVCLDNGEAHKVARALLDEAQSELGLLVEPVQGQHGFLHRSCQEWLAAEWLRELGDSEQREVVSLHALDPQWREVLLGSFRLLPSETLLGIVSNLEEMLLSAPLKGQQELQIIIAALAFQANSLPGAQRGLLIGMAFEWIERGQFIRTRERLLTIALSALRGGVTQVRNLIHSRMRRWFPGRNSWRGGTIQEMAKWPRSQALIKALVTNLHDPEHYNARAAAHALAKVAGGDVSLGRNLMELVRRSANPATCASALEALRCGWTTEPSVIELARQFRGSKAPEIALVAIRCLIANGEQTSDDRDRMLRAGLWAAGTDIERAWRADFVSVFTEGWSGDETVLNASCRGIKTPLSERGEIRDSTAFAILLSCFPCNNKAAEAIKAYLTHKDYFFNHDDDFPSRDALRAAMEAWQSHADLSEAIENWLEGNGSKYGYSVFEFYHAAKTPRTKARLVEKLRKGKTFYGLELHVLVRVWGLEDTEVNAEARSYVRQAPLGYAEAQDYLPQLVEDRNVARNVLLSQLVPESGIRLNVILDSIRVLDGDLAAADVVEACLKLCDTSSDLWPDWVLPRLIAHGASHPKVRALAFAALCERDVPSSAIAIAAGHDDELAEALLLQMTPLPNELREAIVNTLVNFPVEEEWINQLLSYYDQENDCAVKVSMTIAYARRLRRHQQLSGEIIADFRKALTARGSFQEYSRLAGIAGLIAARHPDWLPIAEIPKLDADAIIEGGFALHHAPNFLRLLEEEWEPFLASLNEKTANILSKFLDRSLAYNLLPEQVPAGSNVAKWFLAERSRLHLGEANQSVNMPLLACAFPKSEALKRAALGCIGRGSSQDTLHEWYQRAIAARVLGHHFAGNDAVLKELTAAPIELWDEAIPIALAHGWPRSQPLKDWRDYVRKRKLEIPLETFWSVLFSVGKPSAISEHWSQLDTPLDYECAATIQHSAIILRERAKMDEEIASWLFREVTQLQSANRRITALSLLLRSSAAPEGFSQWLHDKDAALGSANTSPVFGYDFAAGRMDSDAQLIVLRQ